MFTVTGKGRENFSDCHLQALAQAPFELLRLSAQEEAFHDLRSVQLAAQDECIPDLAAFLGSGSQTVGFPCSPIKVFAIQDGGSSMLPSVAALERYAGLTGRLANERSCGMILLASGFAWGLLPPTQRTWWLPSTMSKLVKKYAINLQGCSLASVILPAIWLSHLDRWSFQKPCKHSNALGKTSGVRSKPPEVHRSLLVCTCDPWRFQKFLTQSACWAKNGGHTLGLLHLNLARLPELQLCSQLRLCSRPACGELPSPCLSEKPWWM